MRLFQIYELTSVTEYFKTLIKLNTHVFDKISPVSRYIFYQNVIQHSEAVILSKEQRGQLSSLLFALSSCQHDSVWFASCKAQLTFFAIARRQAHALRLLRDKRGGNVAGCPFKPVEAHAATQ